MPSATRISIYCPTLLAAIIGLSLTSCASVKSDEKVPVPIIEKLSIEYSTYAEALDAIGNDPEFKNEARDGAWLVFLNQNKKLRWYFTQEQNIAHPSLAKARLSPSFKIDPDFMKKNNSYVIADDMGVRIVESPKKSRNAIEPQLRIDTVIACWAQQESCRLFEAAIEKFNGTFIDALVPST